MEVENKDDQLTNDRKGAGAGGKLFFFHTNADYLIGLRLPMLIALVQAGYEVTAFAPNVEAKHSDILSKHQITSSTFSLHPTAINPIRDLRDTWRLSRYLRVEQPDIVFSNNIKPVVFVTLAAALAGIRRRYALVGGLGYAFIKPESGGMSLSRVATRMVASVLYAISFRLCRRVIFHNCDDLAMLERQWICPRGQGAVVSGSGVDIQEFRPAQRPASPTFVFVGRLLVDKGVREYLQAAERVKKQFPEARFLLVGDTDANPSAVDRSEVTGYVDRDVMEWKGQVSDVRPFLAESSVFVLPSYREGVPRSTLEAMACGLAVVTTDAPGCRETVEDGVNGLLVPVSDATALAEAMASLCKTPERIAAMGDESRRIAEARFSTTQVNGDILQLISEDQAS